MAVAARSPYRQRDRARRRQVEKERPRGDDRRKRVVALCALAGLLASAVCVRLVYWQILEHGSLTSQAQAQYTRVVTLPAVRGRLLDREGRPLAVNTTVYSVFVSPDQVQPADREGVASGLSSVLGIPQDQVMAVLLSGHQFAYVAKRVGPDKADQLRQMKLHGVGLQPDTVRSYLPGAMPNTSLAANLLGFVNDAGTGQYGVEAHYDSQLSGTDGFASSYQDLFGNQVVLGNEARRSPLNGADIQLSIDSDIQYAAEQAIAQGVVKAHAESGTALVMDPHTGQIVAWADYPSYDGNNYVNTDVGRFMDPAVSYLYEPGSVMKVVTLAGALDDHAIKPDTTVLDPGGTWVDGFWIKDWDEANHGMVSMTKILELSLNVGAIKAEQMEGPANYYHYLRGFGFGKPSGVDVTGENASALAVPPLAQWKNSQFATASFGQGIDVDMVQMLAAVNVVANHGRYAYPHVAQRVGDTTNPLETRTQPQVITPQSAAQMTWMMEQVVQNGSGWKARIPGFALDEAGKTGTAQIPVNGRYTHDVWASYVGFLPADNPRFTMLVVVRKPHNGSDDHNEGYYICAPIWKQIAQAMIAAWHITPDPR